MSSVIKCQLIAPPDCAEIGTRPRTQTATYQVLTDGPMPGQIVIEAARLVVADSDNRPLPEYGDTLNMTINGSTLVDASVYALDFVCTQPNLLDRKTYHVRVTWREANRDAGGGGGVSIRGEAPASFAYRYEPTSRPPEVWVEFETLPIYKFSGWNVQALSGLVARNADTFGPIINANGEPLPPVESSQTTAVLCSRSWVSSYTVAMDLNAAFEQTVNSSTFLGYAAHYVKFRRAETGYPEYIDGSRYYELTIKLDIGRGPWYHGMPNQGSFYIVGNKKYRQLDDDGLPIEGYPVPLTLAGSLSTSGPAALSYRVDEAVSYATLVAYYT